MNKCKGKTVKVLVTFSVKEADKLKAEADKISLPFATYIRSTMIKNLPKEGK